LSILNKLIFLSKAVTERTQTEDLDSAEAKIDKTNNSIKNANLAVQNEVLKDEVKKVMDQNKSIKMKDYDLFQKEGVYSDNMKTVYIM